MSAGGIEVYRETKSASLRFTIAHSMYLRTREVISDEEGETTGVDAPSVVAIDRKKMSRDRNIRTARVTSNVNFSTSETYFREGNAWQKLDSCISRVRIRI